MILSKRRVVSQLWMELAPTMMRRMREQVMKASVGTLTMPQYRILANINRGLNSIGAIAEHHGVTQPSMSKMIGLMESKGFIVRKTSLLDKRQSVLSMTSKGKKIFFEVRGRAQHNIAEKLDEISDQEILVLKRSLEDIKQVLKNWD